MDDRKKACPLGAKWAKVKGRHKALNSGNLFKPDLGPVLKDYDDIFPEYDKLKDDKAKLKDVIVALKKVLADNSGESRGWAGEIEKLTSTNSPAYNDFVKLDGSDPAEVLDAFAAFSADLQGAIAKRKGFWDQITEVSLDSVNQVKKVGADYKSKADVIIKRMKELEDSAERMEGQIRDHIGEFSDKAAEIDHDDIAKDLDGLLKSI